MTVDEIDKRIDTILDDMSTEGGHIEEDKLLWDFVRECAPRNSPVGQKATALLRLGDQKRTRWYA